MLTVRHVACAFFHSRWRFITPAYILFAVDCGIHTAEVTGSIPVAPTNSRASSPTVTEGHQHFMNSLMVLAPGGSKNARMEHARSGRSVRDRGTCVT